MREIIPDHDAIARPDMHSGTMAGCLPNRRDWCHAAPASTGHGVLRKEDHMGQMDGRVAAITSGSTGIGHGIAKAFLAEGASIVINGRDAGKGARALEELGAGERGHFIAGDVTVRENVDAIIDGTVERFGRIDILVNNAGGLIKTAPVADLSDEDWDYAVKWNLYSAFWASRKALEYMVPQKY